MKVYGYARVSTEKQVLKRQLTAIKERYPDAVIYSEKFTGKTTEGREKWNKLLSVVEAGDVIIFDSVSRMSRSAEDGVRDYMMLYERGVSLEFIQNPSVNTEVFRKAMEQSITISRTGGAVDVLLEGIEKGLNEYFKLLAAEQVRIAYLEGQHEIEERSHNISKALAERKRDGVTLGRPKGSKQETEKSRKAKTEIKRLSASFDGSNNDTEVCAILGISRNSLKKYRTEMLDEMGLA